MNLYPLLHRHLVDHYPLSYQEGDHDCLLFVLQWIDRVSCTDFHYRYHRQYTTKFQGLAKFAPAGVPPLFFETLPQHLWSRITCPDLGSPSADAALPVGSIGFTARNGTPVIWDGGAGITLIPGTPGRMHIHPSALLPEFLSPPQGS